ncbi:MAG: MlaD family protein [Gallionellaceae bacterium]|nr:MlaD family protein [Gallionellaceae bacterium]
MESRAYTIIVGLFALFLGAGLIVSFWWLGNVHTRQTHYRAVSHQPVSGLNVRAAVLYRGVNVGNVEKIELDPNDQLAINLLLSVNSSLRLTRGTYGRLASQGLTGLAYIELDDSGQDKAPLGDGKIILQGSDMANLLASGKKIMGRLEKLIENVDTLAGNSDKLIRNADKFVGDTGKLIGDAHKLTRNMNALLDDNKGRQRIVRILENLEQASNDLSTLLKSSSATVDAIRPVLAKIDTSLDEIARIGTTVNDETLPRILQLTQQLNQDAQDINRLLNTLDQHPESVIFGKPRAEAGPGEAGFKP